MLRRKINNTRSSLVVLSLLVLSLLFLSLLYRPAHAISNITGSWYGQRVEQGKLLHWIIENNSVGVFKLYFKECQGEDSYRSHIEAGEWSLVAGVYQTITKLIIDDKGVHQPVSADKEYVEKYNVLSVTDDTFIYQHQGDDIRYEVIRMDALFEFACQSTS